MRNNCGFALLLVLVVTTLMVAVVSELIHQVYVDVSISRGFRDGQQASLLAESGVYGGIKLLRISLQNKDYSSLTDQWALPNRLDDEAGNIEIAIVDEGGKLNLNALVQPNGELDTLTYPALKRLGKQLELPEALWDAVADWIDSDGQPRPNGAETPYYQSLRPPGSARNAPLSSLTELSLVRGMTLEMQTRLQPYLTVFSTRAGAPVSQVNINTAPREVLMTLDDDIDERMANRIMEERRLKPFKAPGELSRISGAEMLSNRLTGKISFKGTLFRITSTARVKDAVRTVEAVVRPDDATPILSWQEQ